MRQIYPQASGELDDEALAGLYAMGAPGYRHVRCNFAASLDGAVEIGEVSKPLSGPADRRLFHLLRGLADVILVGQSTAVSEGYGPVRQTASGHLPPLALAARTLRIDPASPFFTEASARPFLLVTDDTDVTAYVDHAEIMRCGPTVDLGYALRTLSEVGLTRVLCEGGPRLLGELVGGGLLDELCLTVAPKLAGPGNKPLVGGDQWPDPPVELTLNRVVEDAGYLFTSYERGIAAPSPAL